MEESREITYEMLRAAEKTHVCAQCGANLVTIWDDAQAISKLVCSKTNSHRGAKEILSDTQVVKRGELDTVSGPGAQADIEKAIQQGGGVKTLLADADIATGKILTSQQILGLIKFADSLDLRAFLGHVCLYRGLPYVTIDGYYYRKHAMRLGFAVLTDPMTTQERQSYQVGEGDHAFLARAMTLGGDEIGRGIGIVTKEEMNEKSRRDPSKFSAPVVHDKPQRMAEKRAEWQLLKKMVPLGAYVPEPVNAPKPSVKEIEQAKKDAELLWG